MLLCRELNYFTLFEYAPKANDVDKFKNLVLDCISDIGIVHDMTLAEDGGAIEIWAMTSGEEMVVMYLFPYDAGVVYYR